MTTPAALARLQALLEAERDAFVARSPGPIRLLEALQAVLCRTACAWADVLLAELEVPRRTSAFATMIRGTGDDSWRHRRAQWRRQGNEAGRALTVRVATEELINILRPTVAATWFCAFAPPALRAHPSWRRRLAQEPDTRWGFAREARLCPFFPAVGGRVHANFD